MRRATVLKLEVPLQERVDFLVREYGLLDKDFLIESTQRISKRLGPEQTREAVLSVSEDRMADFIKFILVYYDKTYANGQGKREKESIHTVQCKSTDAEENGNVLLKHLQSNQVIRPGAYSTIL